MALWLSTDSQQCFYIHSVVTLFKTQWNMDSLHRKLKGPIVWVRTTDIKSVQVFVLFGFSFTFKTNLHCIKTSRSILLYIFKKKDKMSPGYVYKKRVLGKIAWKLTELCVRNLSRARQDPLYIKLTKSFIFLLSLFCRAAQGSREQVDWAEGGKR